MEARRLAAVEGIPDDGTLAFTIEQDGARREVLLTRLEDGQAALGEPL